MSKEPSYPENIPVGDPVGREDLPSKVDEQKIEAPGRNRKLVKGAALGIGSAAVVAALLYANRSRKSGRTRD